MTQHPYERQSKINEAQLVALKKAAVAATGGGKEPGDWHTVESPWLLGGAETYIVAGSPDPHVGVYVCDFADTAQAGVEDNYTDDEWHSRNWALAEFIAQADPDTVLALIDEIERLRANQRTPGLLEVCPRYVFHDCVNNSGHLKWKYGRDACTYGTCPSKLGTAEPWMLEARRGK